MPPAAFDSPILTHWWTGRTSTMSWQTYSRNWFRSRRILPLVIAARLTTMSPSHRSFNSVNEHWTWALKTAGDEFKEFDFMNKFQCGFAVARQQVAAEMLNEKKNAFTSTQKCVRARSDHQNACTTQHNHCPLLSSKEYSIRHIKISIFDPLTAFRVTVNFYNPQ